MTIDEMQISMESKIKELEEKIAKLEENQFYLLMKNVNEALNSLDMTNQSEATMNRLAEIVERSATGEVSSPEEGEE